MENVRVGGLNIGKTERSPLSNLIVSIKTLRYKIECYMFGFWCKYATNVNHG